MAGIPYDNLDLRFEAPAAGRGGPYQVFLTSTEGEAKGDFSPPTSIGGSVAGPTGVARHARPAGASDVDMEAIGKALFDALFTGDLLVSLHEALNASARTERGLRIRLHLRGAPALADLPWEQLFSTRLGRFLALSTRTPIVRYLDLPAAPRPIDSAPPLRMLVVIASPKDLPGLKGEDEWTRLEKALSPLVDAGMVTMERVPEATLDGLRARLQQQVFHALHFIGHGDFDEVAREGTIAFEDAEGRAHRVGAEALALLLHDHPSLRLVVLNACESSRAGSGDVFAGTAQRLAQQGVPAVIAMTRSVSDPAAIVFAEELYGLLAAGFPVDAALGEARRWLFLKDFRAEWATPALHLRTDDGQLFALPEGWAPTWGAEKDDGCPFPGLSFFDEDRKEYFFGRETEIEEAREMLGGATPHRRWLQIDGPSGAGKSSFARAGLVPSVRERGVGSGPKEWIVAVMRPGPDPIASLARALRTALPGLEAKRSSDEVEATLRERATALRGMLADHAGPRGVLLVVDQLEEVFTLASGDAGAVKQLDALLDGALGDGDGRLYLVTTVRSDFTGKMEELPLLEKRLSTEAGRYYLRAMGQEGMRRAIEEPAKRAGLAWSVGLPARILEDASKSVGALPLVAHVLFAVWGARRGRVLTASAYDALGGVGGALAKSADGIVGALGEESGRRARRLLLRLVKIGRGSEDTRQTASREEVVAAAGGGEEAEKVLARLSGGRDPGVPAIATVAVPRLVVVSRGARGERVDLVHEALIQRWGALQRWIEEERRALELRDDVEEAARVWKVNGADLGSLPKGRMLGRFREVERAGLQEGAGRFLREAEEEERREEDERRALAERERRRIRRTIGVAVGAAVVFAVLAGGLGWQSKKAKDAATAANEARSDAERRARVEQGLRASAMADQPGRETEALQLGIRALVGAGENPATAPPAAVEGMVYGLMQIRALATLHGHAGGVGAVAFSPDGTRMATGGDDTTARLWSAKDGTPVATLQGHQNSLTTLAFSPDSTRIVTGSNDATARLWNGQNGHPIATLIGHWSYITAIGYSPDGMQIVTGSEDSYGRLWNAADGKPMASLLGHSAGVNAVAFSRDGSRVVTGSDDNTARLWSTKNGAPIAILQGHKERVEAAAFSPDGTVVATGSGDKTARLWNGQNGNPIATLSGHSEGVRAVVFSPDGRRIATISDDESARLWDTTDAKSIATFQGHSNAIWAVVFSPDGTQLATGSLDSTGRLWDAVSGAPIAALLGHNGPVRAVAFSPDGAHVLTGSSDKTARLWGARRGKPIVTLEGHTKSVSAMVFSPDGKQVMTGSADSTVRLWDAKDGTPLATIAEFKGAPNILAFSPDGTRALSGNTNSTVQIWDAKNGKPIGRFPSAVDRGHALALSPDGNRVATGLEDGTVRLWSADNNTSIVALSGHKMAVITLAFSPDGTQALTGSWDSDARLWDAKSGRLIANLNGHTMPVVALAFSPDGSQAVTGGGDPVARLWDTREGKQIATFSHADSVCSVAFSPDGMRVVTGSGDKTAKVWDTKNGDLIATLLGHTERVLAAIFSPDGGRIASGSDDKTIRLWDAATGEILAVLPGHRGEITKIAFSPDGRHLASASEDGTVRIWAATPEGFLIQACQYLHPWPAFEAVKTECAPYLDRTP